MKRVRIVSVGKAIGLGIDRSHYKRSTENEVSQDAGLFPSVSETKK